MQSSPTILVENGKVLMQNLQRELLTVDDLRHALRKNQVDLDEDPPYMRRVVLESDGAITIIRRLPRERGVERSGSNKKRT